MMKIKNEKRINTFNVCLTLLFSIPFFTHLFVYELVLLVCMCTRLSISLVYFIAFLLNVLLLQAKYDEKKCTYFE